MTKIFCTQYVDPSTMEPLIASRLIPLDKGEGAVRPIGVGEVMRHIIGNCLMNIAKKDVIEASCTEVWQCSHHSCNVHYI